ncbi:Flavoprotein-like domain [Phytophthora cactorum]|nr:Flavoprotein-like domain [Phytophthora cactorum]
MVTRAVSVFYGSQTGCAESIAQRIYDEALAKQLDAELHPLNEFQKSKVETRDGHFVVIVCSTTGNGDPPDNCGKFWRYVKRRTQPDDMLAKLRYTVLGLGDTNYDKFCFMGKSIEKRMRELGAQSFYEFGQRGAMADGLWEAFDTATGVVGAATDAVTSDSSVEKSSADGYDAAESLTTEKQSSTPATVNTSYLLENLISYEKMFGPLDTPTEVPEDLPRLQSSLLSVRFLTDEERQESRSSSTTDKEISSTNPFVASVVGAEYLTASHAERKVLRLDIDISGSGIQYIPGDSIGIKCPNRREDVDALLACLGSAVIRSSSRNSTSTLWRSFILPVLQASAGPLVDSDTAVDAAVLLDATSPLVDPTRLSVAFTVVDCLHNREDPNLLAGTQDFHLPENSQSPMMLIGPGTGVAPFMGFLQHRYYEATSASSPGGDAFLFFGCRRQSEDWLFKEQVQRSDGYVFVCGDGMAMAKMFTLLSLDFDGTGWTIPGGCRTEAARAGTQHRYVRDIW